MIVVFPTRSAAIQFLVPRGLDLKIRDHQVAPWVDVTTPDQEMAGQAEAFIDGLRYCAMDAKTYAQVKRDLSNT